MRMCRLLLTVLLVMLSIPAAGFAEAAADPVVLVLDSYHKGYSWSDNEMDGILEAFRNASSRYDIRIEYLDAKYFPNGELFPRQMELLARKYPRDKVALLMVADNPALDFALSCRDRLFPKAAIVFCGINGFDPAMIAGVSNITGVAQRLDTQGTIRAALALHPGTREILVIHDYTSTGLAARRELEADLGKLPPSVTVRFMGNLGGDGVRLELQRLPQDSLVLALPYSRDRDGTVYDHSQIARLLVENAAVPVYGAQEELLGHGIVGGSLLGGRLQGRSAAGVALRILAGEAAGTIPVITRSPSRFMFDYQQLLHLNIPINLLPPEAIIVNEPESYYRTHTVMVWSTVAAVATLLAIIALLVTNSTQRRRAARQLSEKAAELERTNRELQQFTLLAYHNLQEPLRSISGFLQLLERKYRDRLDPEAQEYIQFAVQGVFRMKQLFTDFLEYIGQVRHEDGGSPVDLMQIFTLAHSSLSQEILATGAVIVAEPLPEVVGDEQQLFSLFRHLLSNALKFRGPTQLQVRVRARCTPEIAEVTVTDNGIGIAQEFHEKVFGIFERLHHSDRYEGTGVGLAICRRIVSLHDGRIWVESEPDGGTTFHFTLKRVSLCPSGSSE